MNREIGGKITRRDQDDLLKLARRQEQVAKAAVKQREAELLADFEEQLARQYPMDDPRWQTITAQAERAVQQADAAIAAICREHGIPEQFRPSLHVGWYHRGENAFKERRAELRRVAVTRIAALGQGARVAIERNSVEIQTSLIADGLETDEARAFLQSMPTVQQLMPQISLKEVEALRPLKELEADY